MKRLGMQSMCCIKKVGLLLLFLKALLPEVTIRGARFSLRILATEVVRHV